jgi:hypothetical protein
LTDIGYLKEKKAPNRSVQGSHDRLLNRTPSADQLNRENHDRYYEQYMNQIAQGRAGNAES